MTRRSPPAVGALLLAVILGSGDCKPSKGKADFTRDPDVEDSAAVEPAQPKRRGPRTKAPEAPLTPDAIPDPPPPLPTVNGEAATL